MEGNNKTWNTDMADDCVPCNGAKSHNSLGRRNGH